MCFLVTTSSFFLWTLSVSGSCRLRFCSRRLWTPLSGPDSLGLCSFFCCSLDGLTDTFIPELFSELPSCVSSCTVVIFALLTWASPSHLPSSGFCVLVHGGLPTRQSVCSNFSRLSPSMLLLLPASSFLSLNYRGITSYPATVTSLPCPPLLLSLYPHSYCTCCICCGCESLPTSGVLTSQTDTTWCSLFKPHYLARCLATSK